MKVQFNDKISIDNRPDLSDAEKITGPNVNEIKNVVNTNADEQETLSAEVETLTSDINTLKTNDTNKEERITELEEEAIRLRNDIKSIALVGEASGESIDLDDSSEARFNKFKIGGNHNQETRSGKNRLQIPFENGSSNGLNWVINDDGTIILNGTTTALVHIIKDNVQINADEGETITLSAEGMKNIFNLGYKDISSGNNILIIEPTTPIKTKTLTSDDLSKANRLDVYIQSGKTFNNQVLKIMIEEGSVATKYEPYGASPSPDFPSEIKTAGKSGNIESKVENKDNTEEQEIIMPSQQEMLKEDYFDFDNEKEVHMWKKLVLSGDEDKWGNPRTNLFNFDGLSEKSAISEGRIIILCNQYKGVETTSTNDLFLNKANTLEYACNCGTNQLTIRFKDTRFTSLTDFKNNLKQQNDNGTPVIIYYKVAEPVNLNFTEEQKNIAKQIKQTLHTYKNITHIHSNDEVSPIFNVKYAKDLNTVINNIQAQTINTVSIEEQENTTDLKDNMQNYNEMNTMLQ